MSEEYKASGGTDVVDVGLTEEERELIKKRLEELGYL